MLNLVCVCVCLVMRFLFSLSLCLSLSLPLSPSLSLPLSLSLSLSAPSSRLAASPPGGPSPGQPGRPVACKQRPWQNTAQTRREIPPKLGVKYRPNSA